MSLDVHLSCGHCDSKLYDSNITHNLKKMAEAAGIYRHLWRPDEIGVTKAAELIQPLTVGLADLKDQPEHFRQFDAPNGWGKYENLVAFVEQYLAACERHPDASVGASR